MKEKKRLISISDTLLAEQMTEQSVFRKLNTIVRLEAMEMRERQVYCLIDGNHSIRDISMLLHVNSEEVAQYVADLLFIHCCIQPVLDIKIKGS